MQRCSSSAGLLQLLSKSEPSTLIIPLKIWIMYADPFPSNIRHGRLLLMKWQSPCTRNIKENAIKATQQNIKPNQQCKRNSLSLLSLYRSKSTEFTNHSCVWHLQEEAKWRNKIRSLSEMVIKSQASDSKCWFVITSDCYLWHVRKLTATWFWTELYAVKQKPPVSEGTSGDRIIDLDQRRFMEFFFVSFCS